MPTSRAKNLIYRAALPILAPRARYDHDATGLRDLAGYQRILRRHHVRGASLLLTCGDREAAVFSGCTPETMFRVASITKMATALTVLRLCAEGALQLDAPATAYLPEAVPALTGVTLRHLLSHTSGLTDTAAADAALRRGAPYSEALRGVPAGSPGRAMVYCNLGFGLLGCVVEGATGQSLEEAFQQRLFRPLGMRATLDGSTLDEGRVMPIERVLPYRRGRAVTIPPLGRQPLTGPDPLRHYGHTAGSMYTDAPSLRRMLAALEGDFLPPELRREMTSIQASTPTRTYGLGLVLLSRPELSERRLLGHQGFAYGCVDGAFIEEGTGRQVIFLNGGASEARTGRLGLVNRDVLRWALQKEMPSWT